MNKVAIGHLAVERFKIGEALDPHVWRCANRGGDGEMWVSIQSQMKVIWSIAEELDGRVWMHVSVSRPDRLPSYSDMTRVKRLFIGEERTAYSVWARSDIHVNIHERCLHLWAVLDGDLPLPDFSRGSGSI